MANHPTLRAGVFSLRYNMAMISIIVAMDRNGAIGKRGSLPWYLPADLKRFKELTMGHPIIMGRKTFDSIGRVLPGRTNIVVTRNSSLGTKLPSGDILRVSSLEEAFMAAASSDTSFSCSQSQGGVASNEASDSVCKTEIFVIGGGEIFKEAMPLADRLYATEISTEVDNADIFFPEIDDRMWQEMKRESFLSDEENKYAYSFVVYERRGKKHG